MTDEEREPRSERSNGYHHDRETADPELIVVADYITDSRGDQNLSQTDPHQETSAVLFPLGRRAALRKEVRDTAVGEVVLARKDFASASDHSAVNCGSC